VDLIVNDVMYDIQEEKDILNLSKNVKNEFILHKLCVGCNAYYRCWGDKKIINGRFSCYRKKEVEKND